MKPCETCGETNTEIVCGGNYEHSCHYSVCIQYVEKLELQVDARGNHIRDILSAIDYALERLAKVSLHFPEAHDVNMVAGALLKVQEDYREYTVKRVCDVMTMGDVDKERCGLPVPCAIHDGHLE